MANGNGKNSTGMGDLDRLDLSPNQSTFLQQLPLSIVELQKVKQTTAGSCYMRGLYEIHNRRAQLTGHGRAALNQQSHAPIERAASMFDHPFAQVIQQLVDVARQDVQGLRVVRKAKAA